ncbi:PREDICTED: sentrin-specific protease 6-like isoform X2 [Nicrophorus vespilloides]|uniref:Sentrin-specific protease 6-like isoform X2 n=1 Tax=Nicrophorus vespilloides TaxID=110193 RepID=A0ABM1MWE6_NICVS|nr:PREDICTED: sentrin-specific protease 6-like isoform X2 [Nicrophorus vespilloides]
MLEQSVEGESTVISMQEYQQLLADRKRAAENTNKMMNRIKNLNKKATIKIPLTRPTATAIQTQAKPQLLVNEEESTRLEKAGKRHQNARIIKPKDNNRLPAILRNFVPPPEIRDIISKTQHTLEFQNSIRMFVIHESGEQRLITFTMPKEDCTIQEILEQVGVPIAANTKIAISETNADGINLVVSVGIPVDDDIPEPESSIKNVPSSSAAPLILNSKGSLEIPPKVATPELSAPQENETPKYIQGMLAVCTHCGFLSDDFNKCIRCKSKLPDGIKAVPSSNFYKKGTDARVQKPTIAINLKNNGNVKPSTSIGIAKKKMKPKVVDQEPVILTLSSDDEDADESQSNNADQQTKKSESPISIPQEPSLNDFKENGSNEVTRLDIKEAGSKEALITAKLRCRTIRIGSYNIQAPDEIILNTKELILRIPSLEDNAIKSIKVPRTSVVKVLANFQKLVPVIFYYVAPSIGESIRNELHMTTGGEYYFDPVSNEETYKRITLLLDSVSEEIKWIFTEIYRAVGKFEELNVKDANIVLVKSSPRPIVKLPTITQASAMSSSEVRQLLIYPPGITGGLPINTEDYLCLAQDQFLNDVIIDFYLKYLVLNLPKESQDKIHVFSTFFYKRLTTKPTKPSRRTYPAEMDPLLTAAQKRHSRVKSWTKNVNLFEKDYVVVPINENAHWFLAIICFPGMNGAHTFDGKPYKIEQIEHKRRIVTNNLTLRQMKIEKAAATVNCDEGDLSDKDEAEGDESELDSNEDSDDAATTSSVKILQSESIKQPCILIFDSLAGASRARVVATLRDYLTCEHKIKQGTVKVFNKDVIKGACPKIPQQTNYTDCGLYLLQYVESFFQDPIKDYRLPISTLKLWFNELTVTKKREDISNLIKSLMVEYKKNVNILPILQFPTLNGELVETQPEEDEEEEEEEPMDEEEDEECDGPRDEVESENENVTSSQDTSLIKPSESSANLDTGFTEESVFNTSKVKPDMKEVPTISNRDTMSYLKSKRIIKHRVTDSSDIKKMRLAD